MRAKKFENEEDYIQRTHKILNIFYSYMLEYMIYTNDRDLEFEDESQMELSEVEFSLVIRTI